MPRTRVSNATGPAPPPVVCYRTAELPSGNFLPIEVRIGRRILRTIPPESEEGRRLIASGRVEIVRRMPGRTGRRATRDQ